MLKAQHILLYYTSSVHEIKYYVGALCWQATIYFVMQEEKIPFYSKRIRLVIIKVDVIQQGWDDTTRLLHYQTSKIKKKERVKDEHKLV